MQRPEPGRNISGVKLRPARMVALTTATMVTMASLGGVVLNGSVAPAAYETAMYMANPLNWNAFVQQCECKDYPHAVCDYAPATLDRWCKVMHPVCAVRCAEAEYASRVVQRLHLVDPTGAARVCGGVHTTPEFTTV